MSPVRVSRAPPAPGAVFDRDLALPWDMGTVEDLQGNPVLDTAVFFTADGGQIEVSDTIKAPRIAALLQTAPLLLEHARNFAASIRYEIRRDERSGDDEGARLKAIKLALVEATITAATGEARP